MKRIISVFLAVVMLFSVCFANGTAAYSASRIYAEDRLEEIEKTTGFIPGQTAAVTGNCYGFVSAVCERLFGVAYNGEGLYSNYKARHSTGNFYTVATYETPHTSPTAQDVEDIIAFFLKYAAPGDVVHYGAYNTGVNKTHTFMVQSISNKKLSLFHSNYNVSPYNRAQCHIDNVYWDSFRASPTKTARNSDGSLYSLNAMFYATMQRGGIGITINRYSKYEDKFYLVGAAIPSVRTERTSTTSIKVKWDEIIGASKYKIQYKKSSETNFKTLSDSSTDLSYTVKNLTIGTTYNFRVAARIGTKWMDYSDVISRQALPPTLTVIKFSPESNALKLSWTKRSDITGVRIYRSTSSSKTFSKIKTITDNSVGEYLDKGISYGKTYYYKIERYVKEGSKEYKTTSSAISGCYTLNSPSVTFKNLSASSIQFNIKANGKSDHFNYYVTDSDNKNHIPLTKTSEVKIVLSELVPGEKYTFKCAQATSLGSSEYESVSVQALPKKEEVKSVSIASDGITIKYTKCNDVDGYKIFRSTEKDEGYTLIGTVNDKDTASYTDTAPKYNTAYYYKVRSFVKAGEDKYFSEYSEPSKSIKYTLAKPEGVSISRKTPTSFTVKWSAVKNAEKYTLQYKESGGKWKAVSDITATSKVVSGLTLNKVYYFRVKAANSIGVSAYSSSIERKALPPTPAAPKLKSTSAGVKITWKAKSWTKGYKIYRATSKNATYKLIATVSDKTKTSYTDKTVKSSKTYYYKTAHYVTQSGKEVLSPKSPAVKIKYVKK